MNQAFNTYICVKTHVWNEATYVKGTLYYFHEDEDPGAEFKIIVDENDFPVKVFVRY